MSKLSLSRFNSDLMAAHGYAPQSLLSENIKDKEKGNINQKEFDRCYLDCIDCPSPGHSPPLRRTRAVSADTRELDSPDAGNGFLQALTGA